MPKCPSCGRKGLFIILCCICFLFVGCEKKSTDQWEPQRASAEVEPYAKQAIKIIDQYLNFEIDREGAKEAFDEIELRMDAALLSEYETRSPERTIYSAVLDLYLKSESLSDSGFRMYRDILSFQIGEDVSQKHYNARKEDHLDSDAERENLADLGATDLPFDSVFLHQYDGYLDISFEFDKMSGVQLSDVEQFIISTVSSAENYDGDITSIYFGYSIYDQDSIDICVYFDKSNADSFAYYYLFASTNKDQPTLKESANLSEIISAANAYLGEYAS